MRKVLLDYDNTICDFNRIMIEKWKTLPGLYQKYPFNYEDINLYSLQTCLQNKGYSEEIANKLILDFWKVTNLYQDVYFDMNCRGVILQMIQNLKNAGYKIELNTVCNTLCMADSKIKRLEEDKELYELMDNIVITVLPDNQILDKPTDYDIIIEDNPRFIQRYLNENKNGLVYMPVWEYNKHLLQKYDHIVPLGDAK